jgi:hypothetical protein
LGSKKKHNVHVVGVQLYGQKRAIDPDFRINARLIESLEERTETPEDDPPRLAPREAGYEPSFELGKRELVEAGSKERIIFHLALDGRISSFRAEVKPASRGMSKGVIHRPLQ